MRLDESGNITAFPKTENEQRSGGKEVEGRLVDPAFRANPRANPAK